LRRKSASRAACVKARSDAFTQIKQDMYNYGRRASAHGSLRSRNIALPEVHAYGEITAKLASFSIRFGNEKPPKANTACAPCSP
jgi:hypothetical protein